MILFKEKLQNQQVKFIIVIKEILIWGQQILRHFLQCCHSLKVRAKLISGARGLIFGLNLCLHPSFIKPDKRQSKTLKLSMNVDENN